MNPPYDPEIAQIVQSAKLRALLERINGERTLRTSYDSLVWQEEKRNKPFEPKSPPALNADDWQRFKRDFVDEVAGEKVQDDGMTHTDFLNYIRHSGYRDGDEWYGKADEIIVAIRARQGKAP
jgi:hypothetical protein